MMGMAVMIMVIITRWDDRVAVNTRSCRTNWRNLYGTGQSCSQYAHYAPKWVKVSPFVAMLIIVMAMCSTSGTPNAKRVGPPHSVHCIVLVEQIILTKSMTRFSCVPQYALGSLVEARGKAQPMAPLTGLQWGLSHSLPARWSRAVGWRYICTRDGAWHCRSYHLDDLQRRSPLRWLA